MRTRARLTAVGMTNWECGAAEAHFDQRTLRGPEGPLFQLEMNLKHKRPHSFLNGAFLDLMRRRPTLPHTFAYSTIGPAGLNFRVRDGNGWNPRGKITANLARLRRGR
jgi:hypothetical protein